MHTKLSVVALMSLMSLVSSFAVAQTQQDDAPQVQPVLKQLPTPSEVKVGDIVDLTLKIDHPIGTKVVVENPPSSRRAKFIDQRVESTAPGSSTVHLRYGFFQPGTATIPAFEVQVDRGETQIPLTTKALTFDVKSVLTATDTLSAPEPTVPLWVDDYSLLWFGGLGLAGLLACGMFYTRRSASFEEEAAPPRPPYEVAMEKLTSLSNSHLLARGDFMIYFVILSETLREYLGDRYGFPGTELTTTEIKERLAGVRWPRGTDIDEVMDVLLETDVVKFGGVIPSQERSKALLRRAMSIVELTRPTSMAPVPATVPPATPDDIESPPNSDEVAQSESQWMPPGDQP